MVGLDRNLTMDYEKLYILSLKSKRFEAKYRILYE